MSTNSTIQKWLNGAANKWQEGAETAKERGNRTFEDGKYLMALTGAELGLSNNDQVQIIWKWTFLEGDYQGERKFDYDGLEGENSLEYVAAKIDSLGFDPTAIDFKKLEKELAEIVASKVVAEIKLRTNPKTDYQGVRIGALVEDWEGEWPEEQSTKKGSTTKPKPEAKPKPETKPTRGTKPKPEPEPEEEEVEVEEEEVEVEEETVELSIGQVVNFTWKGTKFTGGKVKTILEDEQKVKVSHEGKIYPIPFADLEVEA